MKMKTVINVKEREAAIKDICFFKDNVFPGYDIFFKNINMKEINMVIERRLFTKSELYIDSLTLWEAMQPIGGKGTHNYHGLTPEDIFNALQSITNPSIVFVGKYHRYSIVTITMTHFDAPLVLFIEKGAGLRNNRNAKINKIVTMFVNSRIDKYLANHKEFKIIFEKSEKK